MDPDEQLREAKRILDDRGGYLFDELSPAAQETAVRNYNQNLSNWDHYIMEDLRDDLGHLGVSAPQIGYSGFCSQGDGAHFTGTYSYEAGSPSWFEGTPLHKHAKELSRLQRRHFYALRAKITHRGHYQHEYCTCIDVGDTRDRDVSEGVEKQLCELLRNIMRHCYEALNAEYDWATGDGAKDNMRENDYWFAADGSDYEE